MNIHPTTMLALMVLAHLIADYTLQGWFANGKCKSWWDGMLRDATNREKEMYRNDYKVALLCHSLMWSLIVCLPLVPYRCLYAVVSLGLAAGHYVVDDAKANKRIINLVEDQAIHALQVLLAWVVWLMAPYAK